MELSATRSWNDGEGPHSDVVLSCRVRLARNIAGFPFVNRASESQRHEVLNLARQVILGSSLAEGMFWVDLHRAPRRDRQLLFERHLVSKNLVDSRIERAVAVSGDETLSIMLNEEDHLRMQLLAPGLKLREVYARLNDTDDRIEQRLDYAFSPRWGYLTACPTNVGTGIRFSAMMHLPALRITGEIERVRRAAKDLHLAVRGYYGEGSNAAGDFYQISNQVTLGRTEEQLRSEFEDKTLPKIIEYEQRARDLLLEQNVTLLDDRTWRALGLLRSARLLGAEEAMKLLSRVRLGALLGRLPDANVTTVNRLFLEIQPAHLQSRASTRLSSDQIRAARADLVRQKLAC